SPAGSNYYVRILSTIDRELLKPNASVALHKHSNALVDVLPPEADSSIMMLTSDQKPDVMYADIGGMDIQKQEVREAVELPLTHFELYKQIGIDPPRGVLMYGPPGCGKTMLAKAVAHHTTAAFIRVVGSEFVQKYLGEGPRMVRDVFRLAKENAPAIIFIDEIDAIATKRFDAQTGGEGTDVKDPRGHQGPNGEVHRDTGDPRGRGGTPGVLADSKATRREGCPKVGWGVAWGHQGPGRGHRGRGCFLHPHPDVARPDKISGADINSICQEGGMLAVRENRYIVLAKDFEKAYKTVIKKDEQEHEFYK
ncbi:26S proteasome regulatory subunit 6B, partial [Eudyptes sclateri]